MKFGIRLNTYKTHHYKPAESVSRGLLGVF